MLRGLALVLLCSACSSHGLHFVRSAVGVAVCADGALLAEYRADGRRGPVLWPLCGPGGETLTRAFPLAEVEGERRDHPHHESCWFAHGDMNGIDFWAGDGAIVAVGSPRVDEENGEITQQSEWRDAAGAVVCRDHRRYRFLVEGAVRAIDVVVRLSATDNELRIGDTKEGTMALRLRSEFCLEGPGAAGSVRNSEGVTGMSVWGKPARWVAYTAELGGVPHTIAMFDAPGNHGHPTHWHARGYGLFAANPFGLHDFTGAPKGSGDLVVPRGGDLRLHYRIWIRRGTTDAAEIDAAWSRMVGEG